MSEVLLILGTGVVMFAVYIAVEVWKNRHNKTDEIKNLLEKLIDSFNLFVSASMSKNGLRQKSTDDFYVKRSSPVDLTESGEELATKSGIAKHIKSDLTSYAGYLDKHHDKTDILNMCRRLASLNLDDYAKKKGYKKH